MRHNAEERWVGILTAVYRIGTVFFNLYSPCFILDCELSVRTVFFVSASFSLARASVQVC